MSGQMNGPVGIIGGGLGGLAAACTLAARGHQVVCLERNHWLGGKAAALEAGGFRFDMGPTILTLPSVLHKVFSEAGRDLSDYLDLVRLDPQWRCFFEDGTILDLVADTQTMADRVVRYTGDPAIGEGYRRFMRLSARLNAVSQRFFFWRSVGSLRDTFRLGNTFRLSTLGDLWNLRMGRTVAGAVRACVPDQRVAQMLDHFTQYVGSAPDMSPAVLCGIAHMQTDEGVWYPRGGTGAVPLALSRLARELGAHLRPDVFVRRILVEKGAVRGVQTDSGETIACSAVVSNCDSVRTHRELLDGDPARRFLARRSYEPACDCSDKPSCC